MTSFAAQGYPLCRRIRWLCVEIRCFKTAFGVEDASVRAKRRSDLTSPTLIALATTLELQDLDSIQYMVWFTDLFLLTLIAGLEYAFTLAWKVCVELAHSLE